MNLPLKTQVKESPIGGNGLFAAQDIPPDTLIVEYIGERISPQEEARREAENDKNGLTYILNYDDTFSVDGAIGGNASIYINHSCDPNCKVVRSNGHLYIYAKKFIPKGQELAYDYAYDPHDSKVECRCGSPLCRGLINEI